MKQTFEVCILAGGLSSRMGRDKSRMLLDGKQLLARVKEAIRSENWKVRVVRKDAVKRCGPIGGVYTALKKSKAKAVLFVPCDMPFVSRKLLKKVAGAMTAKVDAAFARHTKYVSFPFALRTSSIEKVATQIESGDFSIQTLARNLDARFVRATASELFDIDTPEDLVVARKRLKS